MPGTSRASTAMVRVNASPGFAGPRPGCGSQVSFTVRSRVVTTVASPSAPGGTLAVKVTAGVVTRRSTGGLTKFGDDANRTTNPGTVTRPGRCAYAANSCRCVVYVTPSMVSEPRTGRPSGGSRITPGTCGRSKAG